MVSPTLYVSNKITLHLSSNANSSDVFFFREDTSTFLAFEFDPTRPASHALRPRGRAQATGCYEIMVFGRYVATQRTSHELDENGQRAAKTVFLLWDWQEGSNRWISLDHCTKYRVSPILKVSLCEALSSHIAALLGHGSIGDRDRARGKKALVMGNLAFRSDTQRAHGTRSSINGSSHAA